MKGRANFKVEGDVLPEPVEKLDFTQADLTALAERILELGPDPAPRLRVLRDLLNRPPGDPELRAAEQELHNSRRVRELAEAQLPDGTWGRFHSQDSRVKSPIPTTEFAIRRALALGLDRRSPVLQRASGFIQAHLRGEITWADPPEKHDDPRVFPYNIRSVSAAMLALIEPEHPLLDPLWDKWAGLVEAAFAGGEYDAQAELARHQALSGIPSRRLAPFHIYYPLLILSATRRRLAADLEARMVAFLLRKPDGIYYVNSRRMDVFPGFQDKKIVSWLNGQEVLARFAAWKAFAPALLKELWGGRAEAGLWDLGKGTGHWDDLPLSESWRRIENRVIDSSVKVLCLMRRYFAPQDR